MLSGTQDPKPKGQGLPSLISYHSSTRAARPGKEGARRKEFRIETKTGKRSTVSSNSPLGSPRHKGFHPPLLSLRKRDANLLSAPHYPPKSARGPSHYSEIDAREAGEWPLRPDCGAERRLRQLDGQDGGRWNPHHGETHLCSYYVRDRGRKEGACAARRLFRADVPRPLRGPAGCLGWLRRCLRDWLAPCGSEPRPPGGLHARGSRRRSL